METEIKYVEALTEASIVYEAVRMGIKVEKGKQVAALAKYGIFTDWEITYILDTKNATVHNAATRHGVKVANHDRAIHGSVMLGSTVEALRILANQYHNQKNISYSLLRLLNANGCDIKQLVRVVGIPIDVVRGVLSGGSYLSGVLRPRA